MSRQNNSWAVRSGPNKWGEKMIFQGEFAAALNLAVLGLLAKALRTAIPYSPRPAWALARHAPRGQMGAQAFSSQARTSASTSGPISVCTRA